LDCTGLADDGKVHKFTSLEARAIFLLGRHLDIFDSGSGSDVLDLCSLGTNDLSGSPREDRHQFFALLLGLCVVATFGITLIIGFGLLGLADPVLIVAVIGDGSKSINEVLESKSAS
jgi:hypothetical protein